MKTNDTKLWLIPYIIIAILVSIIIMQYFSAVSHDVSLQPTLSNTRELNQQGVYLVSYADGPEVFFQNQNALALSSINKGIDFVFNYNRNDLDPEFVKKNHEILSQPTGVGYWLWKPQIIMQTLNKIPEDAILIYADTPVIFRRPMTQIISLARTNDMILIEHPSVTREQEVQLATLEGLGCNTEQCRKGKHNIAGFMILRNTAKTRDFIHKWLEACKNKDFLINTPNSKHELPAFVQHKHDQSILSVLAHHHKDDIKLLSYKFVCDNFISITYRKPSTKYRSQEIEIYRYSLLGRVESIISKTPMFYQLRKSILSNIEHFPWRATYYKNLAVEAELKSPD